MFFESIRLLALKTFSFHLFQLFHVLFYVLLAEIVWNTS